MTAIAATRARIVMVAIHAQKPQIDLFQFFWRELQLIGARVYEAEDYDKAIAIITSGGVDADTIITDVSPLENIQTAFEALDSPTAMKSLIRVGNALWYSDQLNLAGKPPCYRMPARYWPRHCRSASLCRGEYYRGKRLSEGSGSNRKSGDRMAKFTAHSVEFSDRRAVTDFCAMLAAENITPDILINNAGTIKRKPASEHDDDLWDEVLEVNLNAQFVISREIGKRMLARVR